MTSNNVTKKETILLEQKPQEQDTINTTIHNRNVSSQEALTNKSIAKENHNIPIKSEFKEILYTPETLVSSANSRKTSDVIKTSKKKSKRRSYERKFQLNQFKNTNKRKISSLCIKTGVRESITLNDKRKINFLRRSRYLKSIKPFKYRHEPHRMNISLFRPRWKLEQNDADPMKRIRKSLSDEMIFFKTKKSKTVSTKISKKFRILEKIIHNLEISSKPNRLSTKSLNKKSTTGDSSSNIEIPEISTQSDSGSNEHYSVNSVSLVLSSDSDSKHGSVSSEHLKSNRKKHLRHQKIKILRKKSKGVSTSKQYYQNYKRYQIPGVEELCISPSSEKILGLYDRINLEYPWFSMNVNDLLDNVKIVKKYNDALKILEILVPYLERNILIGYFPYLKYYLVCVTPEAKNEIITMLETDLQLAIDKVHGFMYRTPFRWMCYGSNKCVQEMQIKYFRKPFIINLEIGYPYRPKKAKFKFRLVKDARDGYMEILCKKDDNYKNIFRKCIDSTTMTHTKLVDHSTQVNQNIEIMAGTQYNYEYKKIVLKAEEIKKILVLLNNNYHIISDIILLNNHMPIFSNDFYYLRKKYSKASKASKEIFHYWDSKLSKNKIITLVIWNPWVTGEIAVVYSERRNIVTSSQQEYYTTPVNQENNILIWSYRHNLPIYYLSSSKEINALSFCPHNNGIIVGGTINGDILLWEVPTSMSNNLNIKVEEILTDKKILNRTFIQDMTAWMKLPKNDDILKPQAFSSRNNCHIDSVTDIKWLRNDYKFIINGTLQKTEPNEKSLQFFTCSTDGTVIIWDASIWYKNKTKITNYKIGKSRSNRYKNILNMKVLVPKHHMKISLLNSDDSLHRILLPNNNFTFETSDVIDYNNILAWAYFKPIENPENSKYTKSMLLSTYFGTVIKATWNFGNTLLKKKNHNLKVSSNIHDGPIIVFEFHPILSDLVLTVGGKTFAIWYMNKLNKPFLWRKRNFGLILGYWSRYNGEEFSIATDNAILETWNFILDTKEPKSNIKLPDFPIVGLFNDTSSFHTHENSFVTTNHQGSVKVHQIMNFKARTPINWNKNKIEYTIREIYKRKNLFREILSSKTISKIPIKKNIEPIICKQELTDIKIPKQIVTKKIKPKVVISEDKKKINRDLKTKIQILKTQYYSKLNKQAKTVKIVKIEDIIAPLKCEDEYLREHRRELNEKVQNKRLIISKQQNEVTLQKQEQVTSSRFTPKINNERNDIIKQNYINDYIKIEKNIMNFIENHQYYYQVKWQKIIDDVKLKNKKNMRNLEQ